ncbi:MAG: potassium channel protein [Acidobacteria bacterium]|nr:potassium channel protein [Acidobacteriota bacterium]
MTPKQRIVYGLEALAVIVVVGTIGFVVIEGAPVLDALYMVVITVTTVGFDEVFELSAGGQLWTMFILISGFGIAIYTAIASIEYLVDLGDHRRRRRMQSQAARLTNHIIVCGFGRVGQRTWSEIRNRDVDVVVIEVSADRVQAARAADAVVITGDATHNDVLELAGIEHAQAVIACVADDSDNLVIALSVKALRPDVRVVCRATELESERKLFLAGADAVVAPQAVGAERLALMAMQPELTQVFDVVVAGSPVEFRVEELDIATDCDVAGKTIQESGIRQDSGALILAVEGGGDQVVVNPGADVTLSPGDRLVVVGTKDQVERAAGMVRPAS